MSDPKTSLTVRWTNPATGLQRVEEFKNRKDAQAYVDSRERKYSHVRGYVRPIIERTAP